MSEEVKIKISQPMFEVGELEIFDNNIHSIVEEYSKLMFKEKDQILTQRIIMKQEQEIERLNSDYLEMKDNFRNANDEIERLNNIIKEVREYIGSDYIVEEVGICQSYITIDKDKLLEILDKGE